jgi:hypothetical protein
VFLRCEMEFGVMSAMNGHFELTGRLADIEGLGSLIQGRAGDRRGCDETQRDASRGQSRVELFRGVSGVRDNCDSLCDGSIRIYAALDGRKRPCSGFAAV